jgi:hypothetical protein
LKGIGVFYAILMGEDGATVDSLLEEARAVEATVARMRAGTKGRPAGG